ncbi:hypothetical protein [Bacillus benzoevorans]|uniref:Tetratricopeptide (TPR) repeat protein n=1 Tax=Bacillus benzoevorans TaxID=1456 RepID=A0A7X0HT32_9BACI|nr:hypothetical protein [Bacillus benzoevorans]MBB6446340.1 tetratricopeptide (TPR) repeat protein [Bacillus benzoevorans]
MVKEQIMLNDHRKAIPLQPVKVIFYLQGEMIEAISENREIYYLFFYKYRFLTAVKAKRIKLQSYIEQAFKQGMVFDAPHPLIDKLLSTRHEFHSLSFQQLVNKLELHYTPQEQAHILTLFESFFPKKQLFAEILSHYYEYRRNGQLALGYQIIRILMDFAPKQSLVKSFVNDVHFHKYAVLYKDKSAKVLAADPIFAEKVFYTNKENEQDFKLLTAFLEKKSRWMDLTALFISERNTSLSIDEYHYLSHLLELHFNEEEKMFILEHLSLQYPAFLPLKQDLFNQYIRAEKIGKLLGLLNDPDISLSKSQLQALERMLEQSDTSVYPHEPVVLQKMVNRLMNLLPEKTEILLKQSVTVLLKTKEPAAIKSWISPLINKTGDLLIFDKIEKMVNLSASLNDMQTLGELYFEFRQFEKAIECFGWEMELKPSDPKPLQWLARVYHEMGQEQESEVYQQLCINVQKWG